LYSCNSGSTDNGNTANNAVTENKTSRYEELMQKSSEIDCSKPIYELDLNGDGVKEAFVIASMDKEKGEFLYGLFTKENNTWKAISDEKIQINPAFPPEASDLKTNGWCNFYIMSQENGNDINSGYSYDGTQYNFLEAGTINED
jgi:hypothetical protein